MASNPDKISYADKVAATLIEQLRAGTAPWQKPWVPGQASFAMPFNPTTGNNYRGMNAVWLMAQGFEDPRWLTYKQGAALGAQVRRGEHGATVQYWKWRGYEPVADEAGRPVLDAEGNQKRALVEYERPRVMSAVVFNASQMNGMPALEQKAVMPEWERHALAEAIVAAAGVPLRHEAGDRAYYSPVKDHMVVPERSQFPSADRYYATVLHELGHATGHHTRLDRDLSHPFGSEGYAKEELRAEIASLMLGQSLGIGHDPGQHVAYVESWIRALQSDPREIFRAAADADRIQTYVLGLSQHQVQVNDLDQSASIASDPRLDLSESPLASRSVTGDPDGSERPRVALGDATANDAHTESPTGQEAEAPAMSRTTEKTYLTVPFTQKEAAKAAVKDAGSKLEWDKASKRWWVPAGVPMEAIKPWVATAMTQAPRPRPTSRHDIEMDAIAEFAKLLEEEGFRLDGDPVMDGKMQRVPVGDDKGSQKSGSYSGFLNGHPAGVYYSFKNGGDKQTWKYSGQSTELNSADRQRQFAEAAERRAARDAADAAKFARTAAACEAVLKLASPATAAHPYLDRKGVGATGLYVVPAGEGDLVPGTHVRIARDWAQAKQLRDAYEDDLVLTSGDLLVPVYGKGGKLATVQTINARGDKFFVKGGEAHGGYHVLAPERSDSKLPSAVIQAATDNRGGRLSPDPVATAIQNAPSGAEDLASLDRLLRDRGLVITGQVDVGRKVIGLDAGDYMVQVRAGVPPHRPQLKHVLQPIDQGTVGGIHFEVLPNVASTGEREAQAEAMQSALAARGYLFHGAPNEVGYLPNGNQVVVNTLELRPTGNAAVDDAATIGEFQGRRPGAIIIAEGYATARSIEAAAPPGSMVVVAYNSGNLATVAKQFRDAFPDRPIVIAGDNDQFKATQTDEKTGQLKPNVGKLAAEEAAPLVDGYAAMPPFSADPVHHKHTDWNDYSMHFGVEAVQRLMADAVAVAERTVATASLTREQAKAPQVEQSVRMQMREAIKTEVPQEGERLQHALGEAVRGPDDDEDQQQVQVRRRSGGRGIGR